MVDETGLAVQRAAALVAVGRHPDALSLLAPHLGTGDLDVLLVAAKAELELKHYDDAERLAGQAAVMAPEDLRALQALAEVLLERRRRKDARGVLTTMIRLAPQSAIPSSLWVLADMKVGMLDDSSEHHARRAVSLDPTNTAALQVLALVLFQRGGRNNKSEAQAITKMAAVRDPASELTALTTAQAAETNRNMIPTIRYGAGRLRADPTRSPFTLVFGLLRTLSVAFLAQGLLSLFASRIGRIPDTAHSVDFAGSITMALVAIGVVAAGLMFVRGLGSDRRVVFAVARKSRPMRGALALQILLLALELSMLLVTPTTAGNLLLGIVLVAAAGLLVCVVTIRFHGVGTTSQR